MEKELFDFEKTLDFAESAALFSKLMDPILSKHAALLGGRSYPAPAKQKEFDKVEAIRLALQTAWDEHQPRLQDYLLEHWQDIRAEQLQAGKAKDAEILAALETVRALCRERAIMAQNQKTLMGHYGRAKHDRGQSASDDREAQMWTSENPRAFFGWPLKPGHLDDLTQQVFGLALRAEATK